MGDVRDRSSWSPEAFTPQVYQGVVSGKPRMAGAWAALEHFRIPVTDERLQAYADRKQTMIIELIEQGEFEASPDALRFILAVRATGVPAAAASSSKNAGLFLRQVRLDTFAREEGLDYDLPKGQTLLDFFDADVSGATPSKASRIPRCF